DAAMLVSAETAPVLDAVSRLIGAADGQEGFPLLRAGVARGDAFRYAGDWNGRPVKLARRITGVAPAQSGIARREVCEARGGGFRCEPWRDVALKGSTNLSRCTESQRATRHEHQGCVTARCLRYTTLLPPRHSSLTPRRLAARRSDGLDASACS